MIYTGVVNEDRFVALAEELAERDRELGSWLAEARTAAEHLRGLALGAVEKFCGAAHALGADHLTNLEVDPVRPDDKHVDCVQVSVRRGRWAALVVAKSKGKVTLVGPFRLGKPERPCRDFPLSGPEVERAVEDVIVELIRRACDR